MIVAMLADTVGSLHGHPSGPQQVRLYVNAGVSAATLAETVGHLHAHGLHYGQHEAAVPEVGLLRLCTTTWLRGLQHLEWRPLLEAMVVAVMS